MITLGIDEVGRGPWAGPICVGAVVLDSSQKIAGLNDSKKLTSRMRERELKLIQSNALSIGMGWIDANILDKIGITKSLHLAAERAFREILKSIDLKKIDQIIIDGTGNFLSDLEIEFPELHEKILVIPKADAKIAAVSAASIVAKVYRDKYMKQIDRIFPSYNFAKNMGYGTKAHSEALLKFGVISGVHRESFRPIREIRGEKIESRGTWQNSKKLSETIGRIAENKAAEFLIDKGHEIILQNHKTRFYEIDIISRKENTLYFNEVKFRKSKNNGDGIDAITPKKLAQMRKAAEGFVATFADSVDEFDIKISAISLSGKPPVIEEYIKSID